jgi:hypothetical protein
MMVQRDALSNRSFSESCLKDIRSLGITEEAFRTGLNQVDVRDASDGWSVQVAALWSNSPARNAARMRYGSQTVSDYFDKNLGTSALAAPNGTSVYIRSQYVNGLRTANEVGAMLMHEVLHNVTGLVDEVIQEQLGIRVDSRNTKNITDRLLRDCFQ